MPAAYSAVTNGWKVAEPQAHLPKGNWWEVFGDEEDERVGDPATTPIRN